MHLQFSIGNYMDQQLTFKNHLEPSLEQYPLDNTTGPYPLDNTLAQYLLDNTTPPPRENYIPLDITP